MPPFSDPLHCQPVARPICSGVPVILMLLLQLLCRCLTADASEALLFTYVPRSAHNKSLQLHHATNPDAAVAAAVPVMS